MHWAWVQGWNWEIGRFLVHLGLKSWKGKHAWHSAFDSCGLTDQALGLAIGYKARIPPISQTIPFLEFSGAESFKKGVVWEIGRFLVHLGLKSWKGKHTWHSAFDSCGLTDQALGLGTRLESRQFLKPPVFWSFQAPKTSKKGWFEKLALNPTL